MKKLNDIDEKIRLDALYSLKELDSDSEERFDVITRIATKLFNVPVALITLIDKNRIWFKSKQGVNKSEIPRDNSFCEYTISEPKLLIIEDINNDPRFKDSIAAKNNNDIRFYAGYPITINKNIIVGTFCLIDHKPRKFTALEHTLIKELAYMVEIQLKGTYDSYTDDLTKLLNRRGFNEAATKLLELSKRKRYSLALFFIDLVAFKKINDDHGHLEGDSALEEAGKILTSSLRKMDIIARIGGDEFCVLCTDFPQDKMQFIKDKIKSKFDEFNQNNSKNYNIIPSIGSVYIDNENYISLEEAINIADKDMYKDKKNNKG